MVMVTRLTLKSRAGAADYLALRYLVIPQLLYAQGQPRHDCTVPYNTNFISLGTPFCRV
jgi:hypothetical protein